MQLLSVSAGAGKTIDPGLAQLQRCPPEKRGHEPVGSDHDLAFAEVPFIHPPDHNVSPFYCSKPDAASNKFMAGSRRSPPPLRDQWSADHDLFDSRDPRDMERRRGRGSNRDRGRNRYRERGRHSRPSDRHFDQLERSPPSPVSRSGLGDPVLDRTYPHGPSSSGDWNAHSSRPFSRDGPAPLRHESPPSKRKRTRSPSPRGRIGPFPQRRTSFSQQGDRREHSPSSRGRGRFPGRGAPRRRSPRRGRDRRGKDRRRPGPPREWSRSPGRDRGSHLSPDRRSRSLSGDEYSDRNSRRFSRSPSRHSMRSANPRTSPISKSHINEAMNSIRRTQLPMEDIPRSSSPPRPIPSFEPDRVDGAVPEQARVRHAFPIHGKRARDTQDEQRRRPSWLTDTNPYSTSSQFAEKGSSRHGSPPPASPYSGRRDGGGWNASHHYSESGHPPPRQDRPYPQINSSGQRSQREFDYSEESLNHRTEASYGGPPFRGDRSGHRGSQPHQDASRRSSGSGPSSYNNGPPHRGGKSHFNNLQWTPSGSRGRDGDQSPRSYTHNSQFPSTRPPSANGPPSPRALDNGDSFRSSNWYQHRADERSQAPPENDPASSMPPPVRDVSTPTTKGPKFSFALKAKTTPAPAPKPVPDLAQRMQVREPPPRAPLPDPPTPRNRLTNGPLPQFKPEPRFDRRERDRGRDRDRGRGRRNSRDQRDFRDPRDRRDDRRPDQRRDRRKNDRRSDFRHADGRRNLSPESPKVAPKGPPPKQKKILLRPKPRPVLSQEFADADSVYYRKPGNESVIGAGTYGKVFKGVHVYTQRKVALKKIRMEGEKDGFPVTAMREIKLLQHLRSHNVVSLLEVMVERNECFMVFEYLSHDLTGLINHPTFSLTLAHKKDLAKQMFDGLNYLHHRGVLHRDIKAANILISNQGLLKFADFGLARFFSKSRQLDYTNRVITIWYRPPELLLGETRYGPAVDVWSAACVCMEMFTKKAVFPGEGGELSQLDKLYSSLGTPNRTDWPGLTEMPWYQLMRPSERKKRVFEDVYKDVLTPAAMDLIAQIFQYDPAKRPTAEEVLKHPYFVSEEPAPQQAVELEHIEGDWHEFESKALRKEARRAEYQNQKEREKRKAETSMSTGDRESKRTRQEAAD